MKKQIIIADKAPKAIGPYSAAVKIGNLVFTSGQLGIDPKTGELVPGGIEAETRQALQNVGSVLEAAGSKFENILKVTVYLRDINEFGLMNSIYKEYFTSDFPARSAFQVAALPKGGAIEIEAIAEIPGD
jgi:2-iminobutanoate/2-iminopropanoate deaminase